MVDESPDRDPEIRRRAAWLLGMLGLVAALFVLLFVVFFNNSGGNPSTPELAEPTDTQVSSPAPSSSASSSTATSSSAPASSSSSPPSSSSAASSSASSPGGGRVSCPSDDTCALDSDVGDAVSAINAYRTSEGKSTIAGSVSDAAKQCALNRGNGCKGGWAETQVALKNGKADGEAAVDKIKQFAKLLTDMKSIEVGWAYDPGSKTLYFATIRQT